MDRINAENMHYRTLNEHIRNSSKREIAVENTLGQRFIGSGCLGKDIHIYGIPGNALGAYLTQTDITVYGNTYASSLYDAAYAIKNGNADAYEANKEYIDTIVTE